MSRPRKPAQAALATLILLQGTMLCALFAGVEPHPPAVIPISGIAPFLGASLSAAVAALILGPLDGVAGRGLTVIAALLALVSYGPQKVFDAAFPLVWPAVLAGMIAAAVLCVLVGLSLKGGVDRPAKLAPRGP